MLTNKITRKYKENVKENENSHFWLCNFRLWAKETDGGWFFLLWCFHIWKKSSPIFVAYFRKKISEAEELYVYIDALAYLEIAAQIRYRSSKAIT